MENLITGLVCFFIGIVSYVGVAYIFGINRANLLPIGVILVGVIFSPLYISMPLTLLGHIVCVIAMGKIKKILRPFVDILLVTLLITITAEINQTKQQIN
ncbi:MAG: hypothetical protein AAB657_01415 [Patescibacteria group bacterium]